MRKMCEVTFEDVVSLENLCSAWQEFIRGKRKKKDVQEFMLNLGDELAVLHNELISVEYQHGSYHHFTINDPKPRNIHKATVRDRLVHHAIHRKLYPFFSSCFIGDSFSCQTGKGLHRALRRFSTHMRKVNKNRTRTCWVMKCDIRKFFASIDHGILVDILHRFINDDRLIGLLEHIIQSFEASPGKGIPLGNLTSQLFSNIYMNEFDYFVKHGLHMKFYVRYADDFVFLSHDRSALMGCLLKISNFLFNSLMLDLHPDKVFIKTLMSGVDFLGWVHFPYHRIVRTKMKKRILKRVRMNQNHETVQSYLGLLSHGNTFKVSSQLLNDYWLWNPKKLEDIENL